MYFLIPHHTFHQQLNVVAQILSAPIPAKIRLGPYPTLLINVGYSAQTSNIRHLKVHEILESLKSFVRGLHALIGTSIQENVHGAQVNIPGALSLEGVQAVLLRLSRHLEGIVRGNRASAPLTPPNRPLILRMVCSGCLASSKKSRTHPCSYWRRCEDDVQSPLLTNSPLANPKSSRNFKVPVITDWWGKMFLSGADCCRTTHWVVQTPSLK